MEKIYLHVVVVLVSFVWLSFRKGENPAKKFTVIFTDFIIVDFREYVNVKSKIQREYYTLCSVRIYNEKQNRNRFKAILLNVQQYLTTFNQLTKKEMF